VGIGDRVEQGALLAEIATPEVDDQLAQARATVAQSRANRARDEANREFADIGLERVQNLLRHARSWPDRARHIPRPVPIDEHARCGATLKKRRTSNFQHQISNGDGSI
jgi:hypothetical protein